MIFRRKILTGTVAVGTKALHGIKEVPQCSHIGSTVSCCCCCCLKKNQNAPTVVVVVAVVVSHIQRIGQTRYLVNSMYF